jgi:hypothetical protein
MFRRQRSRADGFTKQRPKGADDLEDLDDEDDDDDDDDLLAPVSPGADPSQVMHDDI